MFSVCPAAEDSGDSSARSHRRDARRRVVAAGKQTPRAPIVLAATRERNGLHAIQCWRRMPGCSPPRARLCDGAEQRAHAAKTAGAPRVGRASSLAWTHARIRAARKMADEVREAEPLRPKTRGKIPIEIDKSAVTTQAAPALYDRASLLVFSNSSAVAGCADPSVDVKSCLTTAPD